MLTLHPNGAMVPSDNLGAISTIKDTHKPSTGNLPSGVDSQVIQKHPPRGLCSLLQPLKLVGVGFDHPTLASAERLRTRHKPVKRGWTSVNSTPYFGSVRGLSPVNAYADSDGADPKYHQWLKARDTGHRCVYSLARLLGRGPKNRIEPVGKWTVGHSLPRLSQWGCFASTSEAGVNCNLKSNATTNHRR